MDAAARTKVANWCVDADDRGHSALAAVGRERVRKGDLSVCVCVCVCV